ncbi:MAG: cytidine deaminase [Symbiobacteriaceae bacterium]|nr:cytidine deaminase [Symbiobacteriaceae bacterium]
MAISKEECSSLYLTATEALGNAYAPYSGFSVGVALLTSEGKVFTGCNVENASYSAGMCAERIALGKAVSEGYRDFIAIAVAGSSGAPTPCGICRQALYEFAPGLLVIWGSSGSDLHCLSLNGLLPEAFGPLDLK